MNPFRIARNSLLITTSYNGTILFNPGNLSIIFVLLLFLDWRVELLQELFNLLMVYARYIVLFVERVGVPVLHLRLVIKENETIFFEEFGYRTNFSLKDPSIFNINHWILN